MRSIDLKVAQDYTCIEHIGSGSLCGFIFLSTDDGLAPPEFWEHMEATGHRDVKITYLAKVFVSPRWKKI